MRWKMLSGILFAGSGRITSAVTASSAGELEVCLVTVQAVDGNCPERVQTRDKFCWWVDCTVKLQLLAFSCDLSRRGGHCLSMSAKRLPAFEKGAA